MMKRLIPLLTVLGLCVVIAGCGQSSEEDVSGDAAPSLGNEGADSAPLSEKDQAVPPSETLDEGDEPSSNASGDSAKTVASDTPATTASAKETPKDTEVIEDDKDEEDQ